MIATKSGDKVTITIKETDMRIIRTAFALSETVEITSDPTLASPDVITVEVKRSEE